MPPLRGENVIEMQRYLITLLALVLVTVGGLAYGQKRRVRRPPRSAARPAAVDYSKFSHATKKHQAACNTCHKVPTDNWRKVKDYPDIADYPGHDACVSCHRAQFFKGAKPVICSGCHSRVSPKDEARFAFPKSPGSQFLIEFPHDKHQDVIARLFRSLPRQPSLVPASFISAGFYADDKTKHYNNCEICHGPRATPAVAPASGWVDGFVPDDLTLKSVPTSHASCFSCHWKSQPPVNDNCKDCHKLSAQPAMHADLPTRKSMKFRHGREQHVAECTTCHINITKSTSLRGLKPDVPITPCRECHNKDGQRLDVSKELTAIDKNRDFVCVYCHTSEVGRRDPPASHYLIADRPPIKRGDIK